MADGTFNIEDAFKDLNKGFEEYKSANDERIKEVEAKGSADPILEEKLSKIEADLDKYQAAADQAVLAAKRQSRVMTDANGNEIDLEAKAAEYTSSVRSFTNRQIDEINSDSVAAFKSAFDKYTLLGPDVLEIEERKALSVGGDPNGGYVVYPDMSGRVVQRLYETSPMRAYASVQTISSDALEGMYDNDRAGAVWVAETQDRDETSTPSLGSWRIPVHELAASPHATQKILDDANMNMEEWLSKKISSEFILTENAAFVSGNGVNKPRGFITYPNVSEEGAFEVGKMEQFKTGVNGDLPGVPNGGDALIDALYGLKAPYRANATWFFNRSVTNAVRKLKDSNGGYIWSPGIAAGQPASLLGYPIAPFEDMPNISTGSLSIAVGDMRAAYQIVDRMGIRVLRDPLTKKPYVIFYTTKRVGGDVIDFDALKLINFSA